MWVKSSVSCLCTFPLDKHSEILLQKRSVFCIWRRANLSTVRDLGVGSGVDAMSGVILSCGVEGSGARHFFHSKILQVACDLY